MQKHEESGTCVKYFLSGIEFDASYKFSWNIVLFSTQTFSKYSMDGSKNETIMTDNANPRSSTESKAVLYIIKEILPHRENYKSLK